MKTKSIFLYLFILIITGCSLKEKSLDINHYSIDFKTKEFTSNPKFETIYIEEPIVNKSFNLTSIFYNTKPYLFEEYVKNRWINLPSNMIYNQLIDSFTTSGIFKNVVSKDYKINRDYILKTQVIKLYQTFEDDKSYAIIRINFDLVLENNVIKSFDYNRKLQCRTNNAYGFVESTNKELKDIIEDLLKNILAI